LLKSLKLTSFVFKNPRSKLVDSKCEFAIGAWQAQANWTSRFGPRLRDCQLSHIEKSTAITFNSEAEIGDWKKAAKAAKSKLRLEQFIYFIHIIAFDLTHSNVKSHRPQWTTDFKKTLKALKAS
ncbi:MAG: hypothetical protein P1V97_12555, partial [Planctomycetota bacterium]|nr:hypothetical protein [Planctomycetota bacterium]